MQNTAKAKTKTLIESQRTHDKNTQAIGQIKGAHQ